MFAMYLDLRFYGLLWRTNVVGWWWLSSFNLSAISYFEILCFTDETSNTHWVWNWSFPPLKIKSSSVTLVNFVIGFRRRTSNQSKHPLNQLAIIKFWALESFVILMNSLVSVEKICSLSSSVNHTSKGRYESECNL